MSRRRREGPSRLPALVVVVVALALAGVADGTMRDRPSARVAGGGPHGQAVVLTSSKATSSAWYCAGPLPVGARPEASSIAVANLGGREARGQLVVATTSGKRSVVPVTVEAHAQAVFGLSRHEPRADAAATVLVDSAAVGVEELIHGPAGPVASPCTIETGLNAYLAAGSTRGAANVALSLYDPGATPSVVSVSFATSTGAASPPAFQGVDVPPQGIVVLDVGHEVASRLAVATVVHATGGRVVVGADVVAVTARSLVDALIGATTGVRHHWELPAAPLGATARQSVAVLDPTSRPARVVVRLSGAGGAEVVSDVVPPGGVVGLAPVAAASPTTAAVTLTSKGAPVVVAGELDVSTVVVPHVAYHRVRRAVTVVASIAGRRVRRRRMVLATVPVEPALVRLPTLPPGFSAASATAEPARRWLLPGGESDAHVSEVVTVANPGTSVASIRLANLSGAPVASAASDLTVAPRSAIAIALGALPGLYRNLSLVLSSTAPVVAGELLYARGAHPLGLTAAAGIPVR